MTGLAQRAYRALDSGLSLRLLLFAAVFSLAAVPPLDPDLWWHLADGRLITTTHAWPHSDVYSFSATGHAWVMHEWLADVMMYGVQLLGGLPALVGIFAALVTAAALCLFWLLRSSGLHPTAAVVVTLVGALAGSTAWGARPQVLNPLLLGVLACALVRYRQGRLQAWWLIPFLWLWANLHSGFLAGVILTGLYLAGEVVTAWPDPRERARWIRLAGALAGGLGLTAVNPYGIDTLVFPIGTLTSPLIQNNIQEWASPDFHSLAGRLLEALLFLILAGLATGRVRARPTEWLWALGFLFLALTSSRHVPLFALAAAPLIGRCGQAALDQLAAVMRFASPAGLPQPRSTLVAVREWGGGGTSRVVPALNGMLVVAVAAGMLWYRAAPNLSQAGEDSSLASAFPVATTQFLEETGRSLRIFNDYSFGGYLIYQLQPSGSRVFIDGRVEVYGPQVFSDYLAVSYASPTWASVLTRYDPDAIMLPTAHPLVSALERDPAWRLAARDRVATVFLAKGPVEP